MCQLLIGSIPIQRTRRETFIYYSCRVLINPEERSSIKLAVRKDGQVPAEGQPPERRDGFRK